MVKIYLFVKLFCAALKWCVFCLEALLHLSSFLKKQKQKTENSLIKCKLKPPASSTRCKRPWRGNKSIILPRLFTLITFAFLKSKFGAGFNRDHCRLVAYIPEVITYTLDIRFKCKIYYLIPVMEFCPRSN